MKTKKRKTAKATNFPKSPTLPATFTRFSIKEAAALLKISQSKVWLDVYAGDIKTITHGRRRFVPGSEIKRLCSLPAAR